VQLSGFLGTLQFDRPKIVYPQIMMEPRFTYDTRGTYVNQKCFIVVSSDLYLLGVLNSATVWDYLKIISVPIGDPEKRGRLEPRKEDIMSISIPSAGHADRAAIAALVQRCLDARGVGCEAWEADINERVAFLYGLSPSQAASRNRANHQRNGD
jgi:TaqI-like C-terminal specificity domain